MLEFVDSDLYFVQDKNNFINPWLQVGSGSGSESVEKITGSGGPKIPGSDRIRIRILIPDHNIQLPGESGSGVRVGSPVIPNEIRFRKPVISGSYSISLSEFKSW